MLKKQLKFVKNLVAAPDQTEPNAQARELSQSIAELERVNDALRRAESVFRTAFDFAAIGTALATRDGKFLRANHALCGLLGYRENDLLDATLQSLTHEADVAALAEKLAQLDPETLRVGQFLVRVRHKQGHFLWANWIASCCHAPDAPDAPRFVFQLQSVSHRKQTEQLALSATHDGLTGLPNRIMLMERLQTAFNRSKHAPEHLFAVLFLDFSRFELLDAGQDLGDKLHVEVARRLVSTLRSSDTIARLAGDEFAVLLENVANTGEAVHIAERFLHEFTRPFNLDEQEVFTNLCIGIAVSSPDYELPGFLLRDANAAFYQAKRLGRSNYQIFSAETHKRAVYLQELENDLRQAVERGEFSLAFQPIIEMTTSRLVGLEALARWEHPRYGRISPMEFIALAEETNLIAAIGEWVLREACRQLAAWRKRYGANLRVWVSVNVSSKQLADDELARQIRETLDETGIAPERLKLEITETAMMNSVDAAAKILRNLKQLGVQISVDDFGTGYSSLSNIHRLPVDTLKIDGSFLAHTTDAPENWEIIKSILTLAASLELEVIAEGVETSEQVLRLQTLGCSLGQGYYFSQPLEEAAVDTLLSDLQYGSQPRSADEIMEDYFEKSRV